MQHFQELGASPPDPPNSPPIANFWLRAWTYEAAGYYLPQKRIPFFAFFYKTPANTRQVLPVQTGWYRYDE